MNLTKVVSWFLDAYVTYYNFSKFSHSHEIISYLIHLRKMENSIWQRGPTLAPRPAEHKAAHADSPHARSGGFAKTTPRLS
jgi:hypothetical protein